MADNPIVRGGVNVVLVNIHGGLVDGIHQLVGQTEVIVLDWDNIDMNSSASGEEAMQAIASVKLQLFPFRDKLDDIWHDLLKLELDQLEGAEGDAYLTYGDAIRG